MEPEDVMVEDTNVESLNGLDRDLQEAFIVEDLLFVLMVSSSSSFVPNGLHAPGIY